MNTTIIYYFLQYLNIFSNDYSLERKGSKFITITIQDTLSNESLAKALLIL